MKLSNEARVGILVVGTGVLAIAFAWLIGVQSPFGGAVRFQLNYNFAGGIEIGSPVRVSGIKVGKVEKIEFFVPADGVSAKATAQQEPGSDGVKGVVSDGILDDKGIAPLRVTISVSRDAMRGVRHDSRFYINMAGIIGERYVEITPGHLNSPLVQAGETLAGVDPPRIDQLLSQSFDLAGKIKEIIDENKGDITKSIDLLYKLSGNLNKTLSWVDKSNIFKTDVSKLVENLIVITTDVRHITDKVHTPEGEKTLSLLHDLLMRLEPLDSKAIRTFLQKEGVKVQMF